MEITRPYDGTEIVVVKDLSTPEETQKIASYAINHYKKLNSVSGLRWRASPPGKPLPYGYSEDLNYEDPFDKVGPKLSQKEFSKITESIGLRAKEIMKQEFPWIGEPRFTPFGDLILRTPGDYMTPHYDGVPGVTPAKQPLNLGSIYYLTGDLDGGETCYPELGVCYAPKPGSMIIHPGRPEYLHEVSEIKKGWRITMNLFAIKDNVHSLKLLEKHNSS